jgi:hypothetical protein
MGDSTFGFAQRMAATFVFRGQFAFLGIENPVRFDRHAKKRRLEVVPLVVLKVDQVRLLGMVTRTAAAQPHASMAVILRGSLWIES